MLSKNRRMPEGIAMQNCDIKDIALADAGRARIEWADRDMPVLDRKSVV